MERKEICQREDVEGLSGGGHLEGEARSGSKITLTSL